MLKVLRGLSVSGFVFVAACATTQRVAGPENQSPEAIAKSGDALAPKIEEKEVSSEIVEENEEKPYKSSYGEISLDQNQYVDVWIRYFQGRGRKYMDQYLARSTRYLPMMKNVLRENGLPEDLVYISLIESGYSPIAHSRSNAVGYWQFIRATGRRFGLTVDPFIDERRDPVLSTRAAAEYFKALYSLFGSWHLALAAYNVGENRVKRAVTKYYTRDFWQLIKKRRALPAETKQYVPKFIAAAMIAKDPAKYGFTEIDYADPLSYDTVALQSPISLTKLANNLSVDVDEMKLLNPKFRSDFVPIARGSETVVRIPVGRGSDAQAALSLSVTTPPKVVGGDIFYYRIRRGDNLSTVARRYRTTVSKLRRLNNLSNRSLLRVGMALKVPDHGGAAVYVTEEDAQSGPSTRSTAGAVPAVETRELSFHIVRRGDNLSTIAQKYGVSVSDLLRLNNLTSRSVIRRGQKLRLRPEATPKSASPARRARTYAMSQFKSKSASRRVAKKSKARSVAGSYRRHTVRRGETLYDVSKKYGVALNRLARANGRSVSYRVMAGEKLIIPE
jgi:membrane-bound lytic murein transglycosylase D